MIRTLSTSLILAYLLPAVPSQTNLTTLNVSFIPASLRDVEEGQLRNVTIRVTDGRNPYDRILLNSSNPNVADLVNQEVRLIYNDENGTFDGVLTVEAVFLGRTKISGYATGPERQKALPQVLDVTVVRAFSKHQMILAIIVTILMTTTTFMMGTQVKWSIIVAVLKKPVAPIVGFCCQFIIMPMAAYIWGLILLPGQPYLQLGYFTVGCCPGGKMSNLWCILLDANLDLSVTLTACSNFLAFAMMPLWLLTLGTKVIAKGTEVTIPFVNMVGTLILIIVPTALGMFFAYKRPKSAEIVARYIKPVTVVLIVVVAVVASVLNTYVFALFTWKNILAGMILPWTGFAVAFLISWPLLTILKRTRKTSAQEPNNKPVLPESVHVMKDAKTIAIETGIQNASLAILIIIYTLEQPDADLTLVMPVVCMLFTPIPLMFAAIIMYSVKSPYCSDAKTRGQRITDASSGRGAKTFAKEGYESDDGATSNGRERANTIISLGPQPTTHGHAARNRGPIHLEPKEDATEE